MDAPVEPTPHSGVAPQKGEGTAVARRQHLSHRWLPSLKPVIAMLMILQGGAFVLQWVTGFRPGSAPPTRVSFSWDMFATVIERCDLQFLPPWQVGEKAITHLAGRDPAIEWMWVLDNIPSYVAAAEKLCTVAQGVDIITLQCLNAAAKSVQMDIACAKHVDHEP